MDVQAALDGLSESRGAAVWSDEWGWLAGCVGVVEEREGSDGLYTVGPGGSVWTEAEVLREVVFDGESLRKILRALRHWGVQAVWMYDCSSLGEGVVS